MNINRNKHMPFFSLFYRKTHNNTSKINKFEVKTVLIFLSVRLKPNKLQLYDSIQTPRKR